MFMATLVARFQQPNRNPGEAVQIEPFWRVVPIAAANGPARKFSTDSLLVTAKTRVSSRDTSQK